MSFKIINPGYGYLVDPAFKTVHSSIFNPRHGVSFWFKAAQLDSYKGYTIPEIGYGGTLCFKFDVYLPNEEFYSPFFGLGNGDYSHAWFSIANQPENEVHYLEFCDGYNKVYGVYSDNDGDFLELDAVNTIWVCLKLEDEYEEDSECVIKVNGRTIAEYKDFATFARRQTIFVIDADEKTPISNLIISDEYVDPDENIFRVSARSMLGSRMSKEKGAYHRTFDTSVDMPKPASWGEVELRELYPKNLYSAVGSDAKVLTMISIAAPAYYTGSEVAAQYFDDTENSKAWCYVVDGRGDNYHSTAYPAQNVSSDTGAALIQYLPVTSDTTFASLNGLDVGWHVDFGSA